MNISKINFAKILRDTLVIGTEGEKKSYSIVNVIGTGELLSSNETLSLEIISSKLGGMIKFKKKKFAAGILRLKDCIHTTACLLFESAKIVIVGAQTHYHSLYACQMYRQIIENAYPNEEWLGRFFISKWNICNIVCSFELTFRPDLTVLIQQAGEIASWAPELFPGCFLLVWIKPKNECKCIRKKKNRSCQCNCRASVFDTGKVNIAGCVNLHDLHIAKYRVEAVLSDPDFLAKDIEPGKRERYHYRRRKILEYVEFVGFKKKRGGGKKTQEEELQEEMEKEIEEEDIISLENLLKIVHEEM
jgi:TATA-box binding protein (TBP) (component of TFIID and TFIIIB)